MPRARITLGTWIATLLLPLLAACATVPADPKLPPPGYAPSRITHAERPVVGLVLGSGAARGFAHIGVIQALEANGIVPDVIVGASSGSLVGALYAGGYDGRALEKIALEMDDSDVRDFIFPDRGFVRGRAIQDFVNRHLGNRSIEELKKPFAAVATDLQEGRTVVFNRGNAGIAVRASSSIPGLFQPARIGGRDYVDGGLMSPVPIRTARSLGAEVVIAVDVSRKPDNTSVIDNIIGILDQTIAIVGRVLAASEVSDADVLIQPDLGETARFDFEHVTQVIKQGRTAGEDAMPGILDAIRSKLKP